MLKEVFVAFVVGSAAQVAHAQNVAKVGNSVITLKDFNSKYEEVKRQTINPPTPEVFLEDLIRFEIGVQEAEKKKIENDPAVKDRLRQELYKALIDKEIGKQVDAIKISEAELRDYYKNNPEIRSSHILIEHKSDATPAQIAAAQKRALEIYAEVKKSKRPFEELVKLYSDDTLSKAAGGDIGYQNRITVVPSYYDAIAKLKTGQIAGPIQTQYGFHIIKATGRRAYKDANRRQIRAAVFDVKRKVLFDAYFKKIGSRYPVTKDQKLIKSIK
ncbi:MAG: peptidylprolyl isomerase [Bdellovibrionales bacterium]|nr:peptidylprolyl isomerase [Bdellovibrionales bacterium]